MRDPNPAPTPLAIKNNEAGSGIGLGGGVELLVVMSSVENRIAPPLVSVGPKRGLPPGPWKVR